MRSTIEVEAEDLLEAAPDAIVVVDESGTIVLMNAQAEHLFGYARHELIGRPIDLLVPDDARAGHPKHRVSYFSDPRPRPMGAGRQLSGRRKDGSEFPAEISLGALDATRGMLVSTAIRDVTERLDAEAERDRLRSQAEHERLERQLQQSQRLESLGQLAGGVAHDFNNLLGAIVNYTHFVAEEVELARAGDLERPWAQVAADLDQIDRASQRAADLVHQLLAVARREVVRPQVLDLNTVVAGVAQLLSHTIGEQIELVQQLSPELPSVLADPGQIEQVLLNLAVNARDAMPGVGTLVVQTAHVLIDDDAADEVGGVPVGDYVRIRVSDTGAGIDPEVIDRVFEPFFTTKAKGEGTGLGLATVYGIVTQAGGTIHLYSEPGMGTTVSILLPVTEAAGPAPTERPVPVARTRTATVLVVEDEDLIRDVAVRILRRHRYDVLTAANGPEALDLSDQHDGPIHAVVSDVVMLKMLGREFIDEFLQRRPGTPVVFMSGYAEPVLSARGTLDPGVRLIEKPFNEITLLDAVQAALDEHG